MKGRYRIPYLHVPLLTYPQVHGFSVYLLLIAGLLPRLFPFGTFRQPPFLYLYIVSKNNAVSPAVTFSGLAINVIGSSILFANPLGTIPIWVPSCGHMHMPVVTGLRCADTTRTYNLWLMRPASYQLLHRAIFLWGIVPISILKCPVCASFYAWGGLFQVPLLSAPGQRPRHLHCGTRHPG